MGTSVSLILLLILAFIGYIVWTDKTNALFKVLASL